MGQYTSVRWVLRSLILSYALQSTLDLAAYRLVRFRVSHISSPYGRNAR
jgi:hypothetical protein